MNASIPIPFRLGPWVLRAALGFYFARIERFHRERVPASEPDLFTSNHPNSVMWSTLVRLRAPSAARRLLALRNELVAEIEAARWEVPTGALAHERKGAS